MKLFLKIIIGFFILCFLAIIGFAVFFPKERVKNFILEKAKEQIDLPIELDDIGLSFFPRFAFHLKGFEIGSDQHALMASFDDFEIKANISTLLGKEVSMSHIKLQKPILKIFYANMEKEEASKTPDTDSDNDVQIEGKMGMDFFISDLIIEDGEVWISDEKNKNSLKLLDLDQKLSINFTEGNIVTTQGTTSIHEIWKPNRWP